MRRLAIIGSAVIMLAAIVSAGSATADTPAPSPSATPVTVPIGSSAITLRYLYRGTPVIALIDHRISTADVNGVACGYAHTDDLQIASAITSVFRWPWHDYSPCNAVGLQVRICALGCTEPFVFDGHDMTVDLNLPDDAYEGVTFGRVHFRRHGTPQPVTLASLTLASSGSECFSMSWPQYGGDAPASTISDLAHFFPSVNCSVAGETIDATFKTVEFGELHASFVWNGGDVDYDVVIPSAETPSPAVTASPTPTVTPARLPSAGGPAANADGALSLLAGGLAAIVFAAGAWKVSSRRRRE